MMAFSSAAMISHRTSKEDGTLLSWSVQYCTYLLRIRDTISLISRSCYGILSTVCSMLLLPSPGFAEISFSIFSRGAGAGRPDEFRSSGHCQGAILGSIFGVLPTWLPPSLPRAAITSPLPDVDASIRFCSHLRPKMNDFAFSGTIFFIGKK